IFATQETRKVFQDPMLHVHCSHRQFGLTWKLEFISMQSFYQLSIKETLSQLHSSPTGLSNTAIEQLRATHGLNALQEAPQKSRFAIFASQFKDVMIIILALAAIISFVVGEHTDAFVIIAIILGNAWMGYSQEYNAEKSVRMLQKMSAQFATVLRSEKPLKIEARELVPGDIVLLEAGDIVPADGRLLEVNALKTDEASLTGESHSIEKNTEDISGDNLVPGDQLNMVFKGTIVSNGTAKFVVTSTGMKTELGKIAGMLEQETTKTPLQKRLGVFSKQLAVIVLIICAVVFGIGLWRGEEAFSMFLTALSLAVAALPEALPAVITIALAQGARRMVAQNALMRKLPAVETLGSVTYICSDKTGTLTQNVMTVEKLLAADGKEDLLWHAMMLNNEVRFSEDGLLGDSTETALVEHAMAKGHLKEVSDSMYPQVLSIPFDSERMRMSTLHENERKWILFVKGAPKKMVEVLHHVHESEKASWLNTNR
ncbi:MAG: ATPase, partial [Chitinophagaceae bacterium]